MNGQELSFEQAKEQLREERQTVVDNVRQDYYKVMQIENEIDSIQASIKQYKELDRITQQYVAEQVALKSDNLDVKAKLAREQLNLLKAEDKLITAKETLNDLLGREIKTQFRTAPVAPVTPEEGSFEAAEPKALEQNPQVAEAAIEVKQATNARLIAKSQYIPDLNLSIQYTSPFGYAFVPQNVANAGFEFRWDPFDWGRRKHEVNEKTINVEQSKLKLTSTKSQILIDVGDKFRRCRRPGLRWRWRRPSRRRRARSCAKSLCSTDRRRCCCATYCNNSLRRRARTRSTTTPSKNSGAPKRVSRKR